MGIRSVSMGSLGGSLGNLTDSEDFRKFRRNYGSKVGEEMLSLENINVLNVDLGEKNVVSFSGWVYGICLVLNPMKSLENICLVFSREDEWLFICVNKAKNEISHVFYKDKEGKEYNSTQSKDFSLHRFGIRETTYVLLDELDSTLDLRIKVDVYTGTLSLCDSNFIELNVSVNDYNLMEKSGIDTSEYSDVYKYIFENLQIYDFRSKRDSETISQLYKRFENILIPITNQRGHFVGMMKDNYVFVQPSKVSLKPTDMYTVYSRGGVEQVTFYLSIDEIEEYRRGHYENVKILVGDRRYLGKLHRGKCYTLQSKGR